MIFRLIAFARINHLRRMEYIAWYRNGMLRADAIDMQHDRRIRKRMYAKAERLQRFAMSCMKEIARLREAMK